MNLDSIIVIKKTLNKALFICAILTEIGCGTSSQPPATQVEPNPSSQLPATDIDLNKSSEKVEFIIFGDIAV